MRRSGCEGLVQRPGPQLYDAAAYSLTLWPTGNTTDGDVDHMPEDDGSAEAPMGRREPR